MTREATVTLLFVKGLAYLASFSLLYVAFLNHDALYFTGIELRRILVVLIAAVGLWLMHTAWHIPLSLDDA
jgi:hypothetical protein